MIVKSKSLSGPRLALATALGVCGWSAGTNSARAGEGAAPAEPPPKPKWETSAGLTFALTAGNSESLLFGANLLTQKKEEKHEYRFGADAGYGKARSASDPNASMEKNTDYVRGFAQYNRLFTERLYGYAKVDAMHDDISDIMYRVAMSPGIGYYFIKEPKVTLSGELGPGYVFEKLGDQEDDYATLRVAEGFEWKISASARLWQRAEYVPELTDFDNYVITAEVGLGAAITKKLELRLVAQDSYRSRPAPGSESNDFKLMAGLNYKF